MYSYCPRPKMNYSTKGKKWKVLLLQEEFDVIRGNKEATTEKWNISETSWTDTE